MHRKVEGHCQGDEQPGNHHDDRPGCANGADQSLLEQGTDVTAAAAGPGAIDGCGGRAVQAVESHQQTNEQEQHAGDAFDIERRETVHVAGHQPDTQHEQPHRQDVVAPAEDLRQDVDPTAGEATFGGREEAEQRHQSDDGKHHAEDIHPALGRDAVEDRETFRRDTGLEDFLGLRGRWER